MADRRLATAEPSNLVLPGVEAPLQRLLASFAVLSANATLIEQQPDMSLSVLPTLPEDQALVRSHVRLYQSSTSLSGGIMACFQSVATIANAVQNTARGLLPVAATLDSNAPGSDAYAKAQGTFRSILVELSRTTTSLDPDSNSAVLPVKSCVDALGGFLQNEIADDVARFEEAKKQAAKAGTVEQLQLQIDTLQKQIDGLNNDIAAGATSQIIPALTFGFQIGKAIGTAANPGLLLLNVGFAIKDEVDKANQFAQMMQQKNDDLDALIVQYRRLIEAQITAQQDIAVLLTIAGHSEIFRDNLAAAGDSARLVLGQMQLLHNGLEYLGTVDSSDVPNYFTGQLNAGIDAWAALAATVQSDIQFARNLSGAS